MSIDEESECNFYVPMPHKIVDTLKCMSSKDYTRMKDAKSAFSCWVRELITPRGDKLSHQRIAELKDHFWQMLESDEKQVGIELREFIQCLQDERESLKCVIELMRQRIKALESP